MKNITNAKITVMKNTILITLGICQILALLTVIWFPEVPWHLVPVSLIHLGAIAAFKPRWSVLSMLLMILIQGTNIINGVFLLKLPVYWAVAPFLFSLFIGMVISIATIVAAVEKVWRKGRPNVNS